MDGAGRHVVIAGGTGALGRTLTAWLCGRGWRVTVLGRATFAQGLGEGVRYVRWDGRTVEEWEGGLEGVWGVVNLAGRTVNCRYTAKHRREIMESRVKSTAALGEAIAKCREGPRVWLNSSTATIYKHATGAAHDEAHGVIGGTREGRDVFSIEVATAWERAFFDAPTPAVRKVAMRTAIVLSNRTGTVTPILRRLARWGLGGRMGSGEQWVSWIHEVDFCRAAEWLLTHEMEGVVNVAAPEPVRNVEMMRIFRERSGGIGKWVGLPATEWMLAVGTSLLRTEAELVLKSRRVAPGRLREAGFRFEFERMAEAVGALAGRV